MFKALFSIEMESWELAHVTMTALAVGDATPTILALTALSEAEAGVIAELAGDVAWSAAFGGEQPATMQDRARPATISALSILGSIDEPPDGATLVGQDRSPFALGQTALALCVRTAEFELDR